MQFDVVIVGFRLNTKEPAAKALERILRVDTETARRLARSFPCTVRSGLRVDQAETLREDLQEAGAIVELHAEKPTGLHKRPEAKPALRTQTGTDGNSDKISLDLAPERAPRQKQSTNQQVAPPPPPAAAFANYQLGEFGLARPAAGQPRMSTQNVAMNVPMPPPAGPTIAGAPAASALAPRSAAARRASMANPAPSSADLDFELHGSAPLELDMTVDPYAGRASRTGSTHSSMVGNGLHSLGERFAETAAPASGPQVEEQAFRSIQRGSARMDSKRPSLSRRPKQSGVIEALREWIPSVSMLVAMCGVSVLAVTYARSSDDALGALLRENYASLATSGSAQSSTSTGDNALHPLLRMTPAGARAPLAVILRSRITGVRELEVVYHGRPNGFACALVEHAEGQTESRMAQVRATGREVPIPQAVEAQLKGAEQLVRSETKRPDLRFTPICLVQ